VNWLFLVLGLLGGNAILGSVVWASIDDKDQRLFAWFSSADRLGPIGPLVQFATLHAWPVGLWLWCRNRKKD
jgi:hypothetical protein